MCPPVEVRLLRDGEQVGAPGQAIANAHEAGDTGVLRLARNGDQHSSIAKPLERNDADRPASEPLVALLFDAGEKAIKIKVKPFDRVRLPHFPRSRVRSPRRFAAPNVRIMFSCRMLLIVN